MLSKFLFLSSLILFCSFKTSFKASDWYELKFKKITPNEVEYSKKSLLIKSHSSASPLIYKFKKPTLVKKISVKGKITTIKKPFSFSSDDRAFEIGLIVQGEKKLNLLQRLTAPSWIKKLVSLSSSGINSVCFFTVNHLGVSAKKEYEVKGIKIYHAPVTKTSDDGSFHLQTNNFCTQGPVIGLWIRSDSDDSRGQLNVQINEIEID